MLFDWRTSPGAWYFMATGIFPIMHVVALRRDLYEQRPWLAQSLYKAFEQARAAAVERPRNPRVLHHLTRIADASSGKKAPLGRKGAGNRLPILHEAPFFHAISIHDVHITVAIHQASWACISPAGPGARSPGRHLATLISPASRARPDECGSDPVVTGSLPHSSEQGTQFGWLTLPE